MRPVRWLAAWCGALVLWAAHLTMRRSIPTADPRPALKARGSGYIYALPHAHQLNAVCVNDDDRMVAMVSRSADGDLLVPSLRLRRVRAARGSSRRRGRNKGGRRALEEMIALAREGWPILLAVDGPQGPRNEVKQGAAIAALESGCPILPVVVVASRKWILAKTWDRFQIPRPFCRLRLCFGEAIRVEAGDDVRAVTRRLREALEALEAKFDPSEAAAVAALQERRRA